MWRSLSALLAMAMASLQVSAQTPAPQRPTFEAATIKVSQSANDGGALGVPPGRFVGRNVTMGAVVRFAYNLKGYELADIPDWMTTVRYVIEAKTEGIVPPAQIRLMVQALLEDRCKLSLRSETREIQGYTLVSTGKPRPGLKPSKLDCGTAPFPEPCMNNRINHSQGVEEFVVAGTPAASLAEWIGGSLGAPVVDETGLTGFFDINIRWATDVSTSPDVPSIYTAVQEQFGMKLESKRVPVKVFVIDRAERPTPD